MSAEEPLIRAISVGFRFPPHGPTVAERLDLTVRRGHSVAILGPNGGGKSTILRLLCGDLAPQAGRITIEGMPPSQARLGWVPQDYSASLLPWFNAVDNVMLSVKTHMGSRFRRAREAATEVLEHLGADFDGRASVTELSGGQQQLVALARAIAGRPPVLLLDEPFSAMDARRRARLRARRFEALRYPGTALVIATHEQETAAACDHRYELRRGHLR